MKRIESIITMLAKKLLKKIFVKENYRVIEIRKNHKTKFNVWYDKSEQNNEKRSTVYIQTQDYKYLKQKITYAKIKKYCI